MKKGTKVTLFAAAVTGAALAGARLARLVRLQNEELNDMMNQEPGYTPPKQAVPEQPTAEPANQSAEEAPEQQPEELDEELEGLEEELEDLEEDLSPEDDEPEIDPDEPL